MDVYGFLETAQLWMVDVNLGNPPVNSNGILHGRCHDKCQWLEIANRGGATPLYIETFIGLGAGKKKTPRVKMSKIKTKGCSTLVLSPLKGLHNPTGYPTLVWYPIREMGRATFSALNTIWTLRMGIVDEACGTRQVSWSDSLLSKAQGRRTMERMNPWWRFIPKCEVAPG